MDWHSGHESAKTRKIRPAPLKSTRLTAGANGVAHVCVMVAGVSVGRAAPRQTSAAEYVEGRTSGALQVDSQLESYVLTVLPKELPLG